MNKFRFIGAILIAFTLAAAVPAQAQPKQKKPSAAKVEKVPAATLRAGEIARKRRTAGRKFPRPHAANLAGPGGSAPVAMPGPRRPKTANGRRARTTAAAVVNANRAAAGPRNIIPIPSSSGVNREFQSGREKRRAMRLDGPPAGLPGDNISVGSTVSEVVPRLRRNLKGEIIDPGAN